MFEYPDLLLNTESVCFLKHFLQIFQNLENNRNVESFPRKLFRMMKRQAIRNWLEGH
jgi:hypothetical protein